MSVHAGAEAYLHPGHEVRCLAVECPCPQWSCLEATNPFMDVNPGGDASGMWLAVSGNGDSQGMVAVSMSGDADGRLVGVSLMGDADGEVAMDSSGPHTGSCGSVLGYWTCIIYPGCSYVIDRWVCV